MEITRDLFLASIRQAFILGAAEGEIRAATCIQKGWQDAEDYLLCEPMGSGELDYYHHVADFRLAPIRNIKEA